MMCAVNQSSRAKKERVTIHTRALQETTTVEWKATSENKMGKERGRKDSICLVSGKSIKNPDSKSPCRLARAKGKECRRSVESRAGVGKDGGGVISGYPCDGGMIAYAYVDKMEGGDHVGHP